MFTCPVNCTVPANGIVSFDADPDIDGFGVIAAFYIAAWVTLILLAITYLCSAPDEFDDYGFSLLDGRIVKFAQKRLPFLLKAGPKSFKALQKAILILSDQQLITGAAMCLVGLARLCRITQYHFNTVMNLALAASLAHSMTFSFVNQYINQNIFFRTWRAIALIILSALLLGVLLPTGSNDWATVYGLPALCGYTNIGQNFLPPARDSFAILVWFLVRTWAYAITVLFPSLHTAGWAVTLLSSSFWLSTICKLFEEVCKWSAVQLRKHHESKHEMEVLLSNANPPISALPVPLKSVIRSKILEILYVLLFVCSWSLFVIIYCFSQVWASYAFNLWWSSCTLFASTQIIAGYRYDATDNGMNGSENIWGFGQQLPLLMLCLPAFAILEVFYEETEKDTCTAGSDAQSSRSRRSSHDFEGSRPELHASSSFESANGVNVPLQELHGLRRRVDTEQRIGMDITEAAVMTRVLPRQLSNRPGEGDEDTALETVAPSDPSELPQMMWISRFGNVVEKDGLRDALFKSVSFKVHVFFSFVALGFIVCRYGI